MRTNEVTDFCKYYNGEDEPPQNDAVFRFFWNVERMWLHRMKSSRYNFDLELDTYLLYGLQHFSEKDDVPITLKAFMCMYFFHVNELVTVEDFKQFYIDEYGKGR